MLTEGVDYTVNYQAGTVQILDPALQSSGTPINVSVENNATFGQQTKRFTGFNVEHQFSEKFLLGGTFLNLNERPVTQKANYGTEPINNTIFGFNGNFETELPLLTRLINKLPTIETEVVSVFSLRGEFAYLLPGAPKISDFNGKVTAYVDDFEAAQTSYDISSPLTWGLSSVPIGFGGEQGNGNLATNNKRAKLSWYSVDPIFYSSQRPDGITVDDISSPFTRRIFRDEIFPNQDIVQGQTQALFSLDLSFSPTERGQYNYNPAINGTDELPNPASNFGGIIRPLTTTDFERSNVEYIEFWLQDPFIDNLNNSGGKLTFNLGNISEDILKDGRKQYENGLPEDGDISLLNETTWGAVVPQNQSLIYAFSTLGEERENQDVGLDGYDDQDESVRFPSYSALEDPSNDNYNYFLNEDGGILNRYKKYNGVEGNSPEIFTNTNRGSTTQPDAEDINRDNTMNTIDSYFEYEINITPNSLSDINNQFIKDRKEKTVSLPNGTTETIKWYQFRVPVNEPTNTIGGISDFRSIRFIRMYLNEFSENTTFRFGTLELVRSDWRKYQLSLDEEVNNDNDITSLNVGVIGIQENEESYVSPPGVEREQFNNNNTIVRQNEQSLVLDVCALETEDSRAVYKNINVIKTP